LGALLLDFFIKFFLASTILTFNCSVEYISLKALCHYQSPDIPEAIQKKIYGVLAPLFSQVTDDDSAKLQAAMYLLMLQGYPKDVLSIVFDQSLMFVRQYQSYDANSSFIPVLYEKKAWSLQNEYGLLKRGVGRLERQVGSELDLSIVLGFNYSAMPMAVLKSQGKSGADLLICCFASGCISIVDPKSFKEIWHRKAYQATKDDPNSILLYGGRHYIQFNDLYGYLIGGYKNVLCFRSFEQKNVFKFYTIDQVMNNEPCMYEITDFCLGYNQSVCKFVSTLNSNYFFNILYKRKPKLGYRVMYTTPLDDDDDYDKFKINTSIYYYHYDDKECQKKQVEIELEKKTFLFIFLVMIFV
jgi:hypothetical protein